MAIVAEPNGISGVLWQTYLKVDGQDRGYLEEAAAKAYCESVAIHYDAEEAKKTSEAVEPTKTCAQTTT